MKYQEPNNLPDGVTWEMAPSWANRLFRSRHDGAYLWAGKNGRDGERLKALSSGKEYVMKRLPLGVYEVAAIRPREGKA